MRIASLFLVLIALFGCAQLEDVNASEVSVSNDQCAIPDGWEAIAERNPEFVVLGERHGTREAPAFSARLPVVWLGMVNES